MTPADGGAAGDWIEWSGGVLPPVRSDVRVHYRLTDGHEDLGPIGTADGYPAGNLRWDRHDPFTDITAYRVVQP